MVNYYYCCSLSSLPSMPAAFTQPWAPILADLGTCPTSSRSNSVRASYKLGDLFTTSARLAAAEKSRGATTTARLTRQATQPVLRVAMTASAAAPASGQPVGRSQGRCQLSSSVFISLAWMRSSIKSSKRGAFKHEACAGRGQGVYRVTKQVMIWHVPSSCFGSRYLTVAAHHLQKLNTKSTQPVSKTC